MIHPHNAPGRESDVTLSNLLMEKLRRGKVKDLLRVRQ